MIQKHNLASFLRPRLDLRHLSMLLAVEQAGSVTGAAELLGLTQPALSRQIREAERRLGTTLYSREKKRLRPTLAGECLLEHARRILSDLATAEADTIQIPAGPRHEVRLGAGAYNGYRWLPAFLTALQSRAPDIELTVVGESARLPTEALLHDEIDLAILPGPVERRGLKARHLFDDELVAVLPPKHQLAGQTVLEAEDFAEVTYVTYGPTYQKGLETDRVLRPAKVWPRRLIKIDVIDAIVEMVAAGHGVSVLSRWAVAEAARSGRVALAKVTPAGLPIAWHAVTRRGDGADATAGRLAKELSHWCLNRPFPDYSSLKVRAKASVSGLTK